MKRVMVLVASMVLVIVGIILWSNYRGAPPAAGPAPITPAEVRTPPREPLPAETEPAVARQEEKPSEPAIPAKADERSVPTAGETTEVVLRVPSGRTISGKVLDERDQPFPGGDVLCWFDTSPSCRKKPPDRKTSTDSEGQFRLEGMSGAITLNPDAPSHAFLYAVWGMMPGDRDVEGLILRLSPSRLVTGKVVDDAGRPVPGATVLGRTPFPDPSLSIWAGAPTDALFPRDLWAYVTTDAEGKFSQELPAALSLLCRVSHPDHPVVVATVPTGQTEIVIVLEGGISCTGTVRTAGGEPVAGARVKIQVYEGRETTTDDEGRFSLRGLSPVRKAGFPVYGNGILTIQKAGHALHLVEISKLEQGTPPFEVTLEPGLALAGKVLDRNRSPIPGARVQIEGDRRLTRDPQAQGSQKNRTWEQCLQYDRFSTGPDGRFRIEDLYHGVFQITVMAPGADGPGAVVEFPSGSEDLEIVLGEGTGRFVTLRGRVFDASNGAPATAFQIELQPIQNDRANYRFADPNGRFEIGGIQPGNLRVTVKAEGSPAFGYFLLEGLPPIVKEVDFPLTPPHTLRLRVVDSEGQPCKSAWIEVHDTSDRDMGRFDIRGILAQGGVDGEGRVDLEGLPAIPVTVAVATGRGRPKGPGQKFSFDLRQPFGDVQLVRLQPVKN